MWNRSITSLHRLRFKHFSWLFRYNMFSGSYLCWALNRWVRCEQWFSLRFVFFLCHTCCLLKQEWFTGGFMFARDFTNVRMSVCKYPLCRRVLEQPTTPPQLQVCLGVGDPDLVTSSWMHMKTNTLKATSNSMRIYRQQHYIGTRPLTSTQLCHVSLTRDNKTILFFANSISPNIIVGIVIVVPPCLRHIV